MGVARIEGLDVGKLRRGTGLEPGLWGAAGGLGGGLEREESPAGELGVEGEGVEDVGEG